MFLISIALKNILNDLYENTLYFITLIICIMTYYIFSSFKYLDYTSSNLTEYLLSTFQTSCVFLKILSFIFIAYCTSFFVNKRKRELGLYSVLGMKKKEISLILSLEILIMGILSLIIALILGSLFFKFFFMILVKLLNYNLITYTVFIVPHALIDSTMLFIQIFSVMSIFCYIKLKRSSLLNMLNSYSQKKSTFKSSLFFSIVSFLLLIAGCVSSFILYFNDANYLPIPIFLILLATYGLFSNIIFIFINIYKKFKFLYYKNLTMISLSDLLFKLRDNSKTFASISLLITALLIISSILINSYKEDSILLKNPLNFHCMYLSQDKRFDDEFNEIIYKHPESKVKEDIYIDFMVAKGIYPSITLHESKDYESDYGGQKSNVNILSLDDFNKLTDNFYSDLDSLNSNECFMLYGRDISEDNIKSDIENISLSTSKNEFKVKKARKNLFTGKSLFSFIVVNNEDFSTLKNSYSPYKLRLLRFKDFNNAIDLSSDIYSHFNKYRDDINTLYNSNILYNHFSSLISSALNVFIGFIFIFLTLICSATIIFFSQLNNASNDVHKYELMKNLGISKHELYISIKRQIRLIFILPSIVGIIYGFSFLILIKRFLIINDYNFFKPLIFFVLIYYFYYIYTVKSYYKIVVH